MKAYTVQYIAIQVYHIIDNGKIEVLSKNYNIMEIDASAKITKKFPMVRIYVRLLRIMRYMKIEVQ